jgi:hypothetical protein
MNEGDRVDAQRGDFDAELERLDPNFIQRLDPSPDRKLTVQLTVSPEDADLLVRIAEERGQDPQEVLASLIREARQASAGKPPARAR